jgi:hypothetical protein
MRPLLAGLVVSLALIRGTASVHAAPSRTGPIPVVATFFSNLSPRVGQRETVSVQFYLYQRSRRPQYVSGARLSVSLQLDKKIVMTVRGTMTNKQGRASAKFTVPKEAGGRWLWAFTKLSYKGKLYGGSNRVKIAPH